MENNNNFPLTVGWIFIPTDALPRPSRTFQSLEALELSVGEKPGSFFELTWEPEPGTLQLVWRYSQSNL